MEWLQLLFFFASSLLLFYGKEQNRKLAALEKLNENGV